MIRTEITTGTFDGVYQQVFSLCAQQIHAQARSNSNRRLPEFMTNFNPEQDDAYQYVSRSTLYILMHLADRNSLSLPDSVNNFLNQLYYEMRNEVFIVNPFRIDKEDVKYTDDLCFFALEVVYSYATVCQLGYITSKIKPKDESGEWFRTVVLDWTKSYKHVSQRVLTMLAVILNACEAPDRDYRKASSDILKIFKADSCLISSDDLQSRRKYFESLEGTEYIMLLLEIYRISRHLEDLIQGLLFTRYPSTWLVPEILKYFSTLLPHGQFDFLESWAVDQAVRNNRMLGASGTIDSKLKMAVVTNQVVCGMNMDELI